MKTLAAVEKIQHRRTDRQTAKPISRVPFALFGHLIQK